MRTSKLVAIEYAVMGILCQGDVEEALLRDLVSTDVCATGGTLSPRTLRRVIRALGDRVKITKSKHGETVYSIGRANGISATDAEVRRLASSPANIVWAFYGIAKSADTLGDNQIANGLRSWANKLLCGTASVAEVRSVFSVLLANATAATHKASLRRAIAVIDGERSE